MGSRLQEKDQVEERKKSEEKSTMNETALGEVGKTFLRYILGLIPRIRKV